MATRFQLKRSSVGGVRPTTSDIQPGELAVNINDRILFSANSSTVFEVGSNLTSLAVGNSTVRFTVNATHVAISNSMALTANGSNGTSGQVLHSNGTGIYWAADDQGVTSVATGSGLTGGTITTTGTISVSANSGITANATGLYVTQGTGTVVNATGVHVNTAYIATLAANSATGSLTNTFTVGTGSYFVANGNVGIGNSAPAHKLRVEGTVSLSGGIHANGSLGSAGQVLTSNSTGVYWSSGGTITTPVRETFVANSTVNTTFTVTGGYSPGIIDVYRNGVKMVSGTDVDVSSGTTITLTTAAANGDTVEVVGYTALSVSDAVKKSGDTMTANLIMSSNSSIQVNNLSVVSPANTISVSANLSPATGNTYDLGSTSARWRNIYTNDLNLSNGLGDYTIVEGEDDLFLYNNKRGKVYKFALIEVKPEDAPRKIGE